MNALTIDKAGTSRRTAVFVGASAYRTGMRILHTSDWHIGFVSADGIPLLPAQETVLSRIARLVDDYDVDVVVLSGDVYDKADPSEAEITLCHTAFQDITDSGAQLVVIPGNHDSAVRLGVNRGHTWSDGLSLLTRVAEVGCAVEIEDQYGPVAFYGIPWLRVRGASRDLGLSPGGTLTDLWRAAMDRVREDLATRTGVRSVVLAHATVADPDARGVARLRVNSRSTIPVSVFAGVDYVALGDLHWPHAVAPAVRYSGSPLPYVYNGRPQGLDFDPPKSVCLVELGPNGLSSTKELLLEVPSKTIHIGGTMAELAEREGSEDYVHAKLTDPSRPTRAWRRLRSRFPYLVHVEWIDPATGELKPIPLDADAPEPAAVMQEMHTSNEPWRGFYGEGDEECLRCGAQPGHPCFQVQCSYDAPLLTTYHAERGLTDQELRQCGYESYSVAHDDGTLQRLWYAPTTKGHVQVNRQGCHPVSPRQPGTAVAKEKRSLVPYACAGPDCENMVEPQPIGRPAQYCSPACRARASKARSAATDTIAPAYRR